MVNNNGRYQQLVDKLKNADYKLTPQRLGVVKILAQSTDHPSVEDIYQKLLKDYPTISLATVYRNVMLVKSLGEAQEMGFPDGGNRYDGFSPIPHPHLICTKCKKIIDTELSDLEPFIDSLSERTGYTIHKHRLNFFGVCPMCQKAP